MCSFCLGGTTVRSAISKSLVLLPMLSFGVLFHTTWGAGWQCQQGPVPGCSCLSQCPGCANRHRSGTLGHAMPRSFVCLFVCCFFVGFFLQAVPYHLLTRHMSFSSCCWAVTHLQLGDHSLSPAQICPYPCRISGICRDNGRWRTRGDWRCWLIYYCGRMWFTIHQIALKQLTFQSVLMFLAGGVNLAVCCVLLTGFRTCSFPCNASKVYGCLHSRETRSKLL